MANTGRMTTGTEPRLLQLGIDKIIEHFDNNYMGIGDQLFTKVDAEKGFYEIVQLAGMGIAARKNEGDSISYDSVNQDWNARFPIYCYEKGARITMEALEDNMYEDQLPILAKEQFKALKYNRDYQMANILNNAFSGSYIGPDGVALCSTAHPLQAGGTNTNRLSPDLDLSEDAVEQAVILVDNFLNPDGMQSEYMTKNLVVPVALKFVAARILGSNYRTSTSDNDINAINHRGDVEDYMVWKRLSSATSWFLTTNAENCLIMAEKKGIQTRSFKDNYTFDTVVVAYERFRALFADHRGIVGTVGP